MTARTAKRRREEERENTYHSTTNKLKNGNSSSFATLESGANVSTNNVLNPFTPFGDCSLIRMINLYANVAQVAATAELSGCLDMVTSASARLLNLKDYGIAVGNPADLVVLDCVTKAQAVCEIAQPLFGLKRGVRTFDKPAAMLHKPN